MTSGLAAKQSDDCLSGRSLFMLCLTAFIEYCCIGIMIAVMPFYILKSTSSLHSAIISIGVVQAAYALSQFSSANLIGTISDIYGRKRVLLVTLSLTTILVFSLSYVTAFFLILGLRVLTGLSQHSLVIVNSYVATLSSKDRLAANLSRISASNGIGFVAGASLVSLAGHFGLPFLIQACALITFVNVLLVYFFIQIKDSPRALTTVLSPAAYHLKNSSRSSSILRGLFGQLAMNSQTLSYFFQALGGFTLLSIWTIYFKIKLSWTPSQAGTTLFVYGLALFFSQVLLPKLLLRRTSLFTLTSISLLSYMVISLTYSLVSSMAAISALMLVNVVGYLGDSLIRSKVASSYSQDIQGSVMGGLTSLQSLGLFLAPLLGALIVYPYSLQPGNLFFAILPMLVISLLYGLALVFWVQSHRSAGRSLAV